MPTGTEVNGNKLPKRTVPNGNNTKKGGKALLRKSKKSKKSRNVKQEDVDMNMYYLNNSGQAMYTFADDESAEVEEKKKKESWLEVFK